MAVNNVRATGSAAEGSAAQAGTSQQREHTRCVGDQPHRHWNQSSTHRETRDTRESGVSGSTSYIVQGRLPVM
jgi:hypothetical protein